MENEKKVTEKVANEKVENKTLYVERGSFKGSDGREFWSYFVKGKIRGRDVKIDFMPKDKGGYEPLDIVFDVNPIAELVMSEEEMTNDNGKTTKYTTYKVKNVDEFGVVYECGIKPARDSDKALLSMLLNTLGCNK